MNSRTQVLALLLALAALATLACGVLDLVGAQSAAELLQPPAWRSAYEYEREFDV